MPAGRINSYRNQSLRLSALGILLIALLLLVNLGSVRMVVKVLLSGTRRNNDVRGIDHPARRKIRHCSTWLALLLVIGIGLNYALFFNRRECATITIRACNHLSLVICSLDDVLVIRHADVVANTGIACRWTNGRARIAALPGVRISVGPS